MKKFYQLNTIIFLIIIFLFSINIKNVLAANEPDILCPSSGETPTEILIYYHGLLSNQGATSPYKYLSNEESLNVFSGEISKIRSAIPGIIGVHIKTNACLDSSSCVYYNNNLATILSLINSSCNISNASSLPLSVAGHSNGGSPVNSMKSSATKKVIFLDALYGNFAAGVNCEKLIIVGGQTSHDSRFKNFTDGAVTRCLEETGLIYEKGQWTNINDHYNTIGRLSALYTGAEDLTSTKPEFVKSPDLNPLGQLNVKIPGIDELVKKYPIVCEGDDKESCKIPWIGIYIYAIYNYLLGIGGVLAAIALMIGGVLWLVSTGNASRVSQAKSWITGSLTGLIILLTSYVLLYEINPELLGMRYTKMETIEPLDQDAEGTAPSDMLLMSMGINESEWITLQHDNITNSGMIGHKDMVEVVKRAADCMKLHGYKIRVSSFSRTVQEQARIYNNNYYTQNTCKGIKDKKPSENEACCPFPIGEKICPHNTGHAIDLWGWDPNSTCANKIGKAAQKQLQECMFDEGAYILSSECWHFEYPAISSSGRNQTINFNGGSCAPMSAGTCP
ncbi:MAG TPA: pilin [bacterium]|nr:pilin [bacterium]